MQVAKVWVGVAEPEAAVAAPGPVAA